MRCFRFPFLKQSEFKRHSFTTAGNAGLLPKGRCQPAGFFVFMLPPGSGTRRKSGFNTAAGMIPLFHFVPRAQSQNKIRVSNGERQNQMEITFGMI